MKKKTIIIYYADDDADDIHFFVLASKALADEVHIFEDGHALAAAIENADLLPTVIFIDLNMPGLSGQGLIRRLRNNARTAKTPIVVLSTATDLDIISATKADGANLYICKPNSVGKLRLNIAHAMAVNWKSFKPGLANFFIRTF